ncbi:phosphonate C-P lyase system protein PhnG, partial [Zavarzinia sp.]|uniref:phosphonate C-P lyase system protein PhnG n=1 Tax=Zavarzinia sp. TaxID=2027920 RepID=UPI00356814D3
MTRRDNGKPMIEESDNQARRQRLRLLAGAAPADLAAALDEAGAVPDLRLVRAPECGLVMVRGRAGGTGERFNIGEMTVSRCTVADADGRLGVGMVAGRDRAKAEMVAKLDLVAQRPGPGAGIAARLLGRLEAQAARAAAARAARAAAT